MLEEGKNLKETEKTEPTIDSQRLGEIQGAEGDAALGMTGPEEPAGTAKLTIKIADDGIEREKNPNEWKKFVRRLGRAANVANKWAWEKPQLSKHGYTYNETSEFHYGHSNLLRAIGVLAYNLVAGLGGLAWNSTVGRITGITNSQSGIGKVKSEPLTLKERTQEELDIISAGRELVYTGTMLGGNIFTDGMTEEDELNPDKLKSTNWIYRFITSRQKDWRDLEDGYLSKKKVHKAALTRPAEYDKNALDSEYRAHQILDFWKKDIKRNPNFAAVLSIISELNSDGYWDFHNINDDAVEELSKIFRQSGDTGHLKIQSDKYIENLRRAIETKAGQIWERYMRNNGDAPVSAEAAILRGIEHEKEEFDNIQRRSDGGKEKWRSAAKKIEAMFDEKVLEVGGLQRYYTVKAVKGRDLPPNAREKILKNFDAKFNSGKEDRWWAIGKAMERKSGEWDYANVSTIAMKEKYLLDRNRQKAIEAFEDTDFVEFTVHLYGADGEPQIDPNGHNLTEEGRVVGFLDSRSGGVVVPSGDVVDNNKLYFEIKPERRPDVSLEFLAA